MAGTRAGRVCVGGYTRRGGKRRLQGNGYCDEQCPGL